MKQQKDCTICGKFFYSYNPNPTFCSTECKAKSQLSPLNAKSDEIIALYKSGNTMDEIAALFCTSSKIILNILKRNEVKRRIAFKRNQYGENNSTWKGGKIKRNGYILIRKPDHPFASKRGLIMEHRLVMEKHIGRYLTPNEAVHHKNFIRDDNRIENLELMTRSEHVSLHNKLRAQNNG